MDQPHMIHTMSAMPISIQDARPKATAVRAITPSTRAMTPAVRGESAQTGWARLETYASAARIFCLRADIGRRSINLRLRAANELHLIRETPLARIPEG